MNRLVAEVNWRLASSIRSADHTPFFNLRGDFYSAHNVPRPGNSRADRRRDRNTRHTAAGILYAYPFVSHSATGAHVIGLSLRSSHATAAALSDHLPDEAAQHRLR